MTLRSPLVSIIAAVVAALGLGLAVLGVGMYVQGDRPIHAAAPVTQTTALKQDRTRVTCFNGTKYGRSEFYRGWFCVPGTEHRVN